MYISPTFYQHSVDNQAHIFAGPLFLVRSYAHLKVPPCKNIKLSTIYLHAFSMVAPTFCSGLPEVGRRVPMLLSFCRNVQNRNVQECILTKGSELQYKDSVVVYCNARYISITPCSWKIMPSVFGILPELWCVIPWTVCCLRQLFACIISSYVILAPLHCFGY